MSFKITSSVVLTCDKCQKSSIPIEGDLDNARLFMSKSAWSYYNGKDYCSVCMAEQRSKEYASHERIMIDCPRCGTKHTVTMYTEKPVNMPESLMKWNRWYYCPNTSQQTFFYLYIETAPNQSPK